MGGGGYNGVGMTPKKSMMVAAAAVIGAGAALVALTHMPAGRAEVVAVPVEGEEGVLVDAEVRFSGKPVRLVIRQRGRVLAELAEGAVSPWCTTLRLRQPAEVEVEAEWPEAKAPQAVELLVLPPGKPEVSTTRWSDAEAPGTLHDIYSLPW